MAARASHKTLALDLVLDAFRLANVLGQVGNRLAGRYGLTAQQWLALTSIGVAGEAGVTPTEIGKTALVSPQNVTGLLDRLERAGYVQRKSDGADRRSYRVHLSEKGEHVFQALNPLGAGWAQKAIAEMSAENIITLHSLLGEYLAAATRAVFADGQSGKAITPARTLKPSATEKRHPAVRAKEGRGRPQRLAAFLRAVSL